MRASVMGSVHAVGRAVVAAISSVGRAGYLAVGAARALRKWEIWGPHLAGQMATRVWNVNQDGSLGSEVLSFPLENRRRVLVEVAVSWNRLGRQSTRTATEVLRTYVAPR